MSGFGEASFESARLARLVTDRYVLLSLGKVWLARLAGLRNGEERHGLAGMVRLVVLYSGTAWIGWQGKAG